MQAESFKPNNNILSLNRSKIGRQNLDNRDNVDTHNLLVFELGYTGHYPSYIRHLAQYWCEKELPGKLDIIVSPKFLQYHADVVDIAASCIARNLNFVPITPDEEASLIPRNSSIHRAFRSLQEWTLLCKYATLLNATQCLLLYFDSFQTALLLGTRLPCPFSGIYFRPTFHYSSFTHYLPSFKERLQHWREKFILPKILRHPQMQNLFCLDPFAVKHIEQFLSKAKIVHLPDPVQVDYVPVDQQEKFKERLGIEPSRKIFLLFGSLYDRRKGLEQLIEAISTIPPFLCQKLCLLLVGQLGVSETSLIKVRIAEISQSLPVQIIVCDEFVSDREVHLCFHSSDVILAPYQHHIGMSGILVQAAAAQKPILSSDYGLMGEITRRWQLGLTVDSTEPSEIAKGLIQFLLQSPQEFGNRARMKAFAEQNSVERFANTIFQYA